MNEIKCWHIMCIYIYVYKQCSVYIYYILYIYTIYYIYMYVYCVYICASVYAARLPRSRIDPDTDHLHRPCCASVRDSPGGSRLPGREGVGEPEGYPYIYVSININIYIYIYDYMYYTDTLYMHITI